MCGPGGVLTDEPLAHSGRRDRGIPPQRYWEHAGNVAEGAESRARSAARYWSGEREGFCAEVRAAAWFHDCGKLCAENQAVLRRSESERLPIEHTDAGAALLLGKGAETAAMLVRSHHAGLPSVPEERRRVTENPPGKAFRGRDTLAHTDRQAGEYRRKYESRGIPIGPRGTEVRARPGLTHRIALSCLVDADHSDTARHYGEASPARVPPPQWAERLAALDAFVERLAAEAKGTPREKERTAVYKACRNTETGPAMRICEAPVGSGKTTAVMAHLLRVAEVKQLRHILVVLPYTNIIQQSVNVYRKALALPGERPEEVVAELHHLAEFERPESRHMAALWSAPITVTTGVQFFETLAANKPASLRKLHELPGSAVFVDEQHTALPAWLWPQTWLWMEELARGWGCHFVLASGSLARFWNIKGVVNAVTEPPDLLPEALKTDLEQTERRRIGLRRHGEVMGLEEVLRFIGEREGPRLVILNTVQNAAVVADHMRRGGHDVLHLSTALAPVHRKRIVEEVKERLKGDADRDWALVATSCVEAGLDFSFRSAVRESCSVASAIQTGGRTNRGGEWAGCEVWDVRLNDPLFNEHPGFEDSRRVLEGLFEEGVLEEMSPAEAVTEAVRREILCRYSDAGEKLKKQEERLDFPYVAEKYRVIDAPTRTVVVDRQTAEKLEHGERLSSREIVLHSVQMWARRVEELRIEEFRRFPGLYRWTDRYDERFLGYMAGALEHVYARKSSAYYS